MLEREYSIHSDIGGVILDERMLSPEPQIGIRVEKRFDEVFVCTVMIRSWPIVPIAASKIPVPAAKMPDRIPDDADRLQRTDIIAEKRGNSTLIQLESEMLEPRVASQNAGGVGRVGLMHAGRSAFPGAEEYETFTWKHQHMETPTNEPTFRNPAGRTETPTLEATPASPNHASKSHQCRTAPCIRVQSWTGLIIMRRW